VQRIHLSIKDFVENDLSALDSNIAMMVVAYPADTPSSVFSITRDLLSVVFCN
jgi:hypothetical protein